MRRLTMVLCAAVLAGGAWARPKPTPLAPLYYPPQPRPPPQNQPQYLPVNVQRLTALGDFHMLKREDHLLPEPRCKGIAPKGLYRASQGLLIYRVMPSGKIVAIGTAKVRELHPLPNGLERVVLGFRSKYVTLRTDNPERFATEPVIRAEWEPGFAAGQERYFTYPSNLTGLPYWKYEHLRDQKVWVGMSRAHAQMVMGGAAEVETRRTSFGWREVWTYPRSVGDETKLVFANNQLRSWKDSWAERQDLSERWSWQKRPTKNPWVGRTTGF